MPERCDICTTRLDFEVVILGKSKKAHARCFKALTDVKKAELFIVAAAEFLNACTDKFDITSLVGLRKAYRCLVVKAKKAMKAFSERVRETLSEIFKDVAALLGLPAPA